MNLPQTPRQASPMARGTARPTQNRIQSRGRKANHKIVFGIGHETIVAAAAQSTSYLLTTLHGNSAEPLSSASEANHCTIGTSLHVKKEQRSVMATQTAVTASAKQFTAEEKNACSIDAMLNGGTCEACQ